MEIKAFIFDLDGVLVDTARHHYRAWRRLANELGFDLTHEQNELLKGVSRMASLEIILGIGGVTADEARKAAWAERKNAWYVELISAMTPDEALPGVREFLAASRAAGLRLAVGSASKNTPAILRGTGLDQAFDAVADGNRTSRAKPDPEVFLIAARDLGVEPAACVVFEDAAAGIEAARAAGMRAVGIGRPADLPRADIVLRGFAGIAPSVVITQLASIAPSAALRG